MDSKQIILLTDSRASIHGTKRAESYATLMVVMSRVVINTSGTNSRAQPIKHFPGPGERILIRHQAGPIGTLRDETHRVFDVVVRAPYRISASSAERLIYCDIPMVMLSLVQTCAGPVEGLAADRTWLHASL